MSEWNVIHENFHTKYSVLTAPDEHMPYIIQLHIMSKHTERDRETDRQTDRDRDREAYVLNNTVLLTFKAGVHLVQVVQHITRWRARGWRVESTPAAVARIAGWSVTLVWSVAATWRVAVGRRVAAAMFVVAVPPTVVTWSVASVSTAAAVVYPKK